MKSRKLSIAYTPAPQQGFLGPGHTARPVLQGNFSQTDPFILLMDDMLDKKGTDPAGGPHPHAGFETVTLVLEGKLGDGKHTLRAGDFQMMTAGSGVVHTETIDTETRMRLLQLWLTLPKKDRWTSPRLQDLSLANAPKIVGKGLEISVYSGSLAGVTSPVNNHVPVIIADFRMQDEVSTIQTLPASYNAFVYVIEGSVSVGEEKKVLKQNQVGWLDKYNDEDQSELLLTTGESGAHFVLYAGQPTHDNIVSYGPFIGDKQQDIVRLYNEYHEGRMKHISEMPEAHLALKPA